VLKIREVVAATFAGVCATAKPGKNRNAANNIIR